MYSTASNEFVPKVVGIIVIWIKFIHSHPFSVKFSHSVMHNPLQPHGLLCARLPYSSPTPRACSNSCPLSWWCHSTISFYVVPFSSCLQTFPTSWSFQMGQFFSSGGQSIGVSASASVLPMNIQDWFPLAWTGWISLQPKFLKSLLQYNSQKHQFFGTKFSFWSIPHIHTWQLGKP